jgi:hypothetical protein
MGYLLTATPLPTHIACSELLSAIAKATRFFFTEPGPLLNINTTLTALCFGKITHPTFAKKNTTHSLEDLLTNPALKRETWEMLKSLFRIPGK